MILTILLDENIKIVIIPPLVCWHVQEEGVRISGLSFKRKMMFDDIVPWGNVIRVNVRDCEAMY